jgi:hypothetical protein
MTARHRGVILRCDHHEADGTCESVQQVPEARTIPEARSIARGVGWRYRLRRIPDSEIPVAYYRDLCPTCATADAQQRALARELPGQAALDQETP